MQLYSINKTKNFEIEMISNHTQTEIKKKEFYLSIFYKKYFDNFLLQIKYSFFPRHLCLQIQITPRTSLC